MLLTEDEEFLCQKTIFNISTPRIAREEIDSIRTWTDDYSNLYQLLR